MTIVPIDAVPAAHVESLLDQAFGGDRRSRTAYRLRDGSAQIADLSFAMLEADGGLLATLQSWPVRFAGDDGRAVPMVLLGPVAVAPDNQRAGLGRRLTDHMLAAAAASARPGHDVLMLIGDPEYYGRFFGFDAARTAAWRLPGPVEHRRLLARGAKVPDGPGTVLPGH